MLRGSKPGERRGGRKRNTPNRRTILVDRILAIGLEHPSLSLHGFLLKVVKDPKLPADTRMAVAPQSLPLKRTLEALTGRPGARRGATAPAPVSVPREWTPLTLDALFGVVQDAAADAEARRKAALKIAEYLLPKVAKKAKALPDEYEFRVSPDLASEYRDIQLELRALSNGPNRKIPAIAERSEHCRHALTRSDSRSKCRVLQNIASMKRPKITSNWRSLPSFATTRPLLPKRRRPKKRIGGCASMCLRIVRSKSGAAGSRCCGTRTGDPKRAGCLEILSRRPSRPKIKKSLSGYGGFTRNRAEASFGVARLTGVKPVKSLNCPITTRSRANGHLGTAISIRRSRKSARLVS